MDPDKLLSRLVTDQDVEHIREWITPAERAVLFALRMGIQITDRKVARTFRINRYQAGQLIERMRALINER